MVDYIEIKSYAHAEALGIKPVDSIVSISGVVIEAGKSEPPYTVVGFERGYTYKDKEVVFARGLREYEVLYDEDGFNEPQMITAINDKVALILAKHISDDFTLFEKKVRYRQVED